MFYLLLLDLLDIFLLLCLTFRNLFRLNFCEKACKPVLSLIPLGRLGLEALYLLKAFSHSYFFTVEHRQWQWYPLQEHKADILLSYQRHSLFYSVIIKHAFCIRSERERKFCPPISTFQLLSYILFLCPPPPDPSKKEACNCLELVAHGANKSNVEYYGFILTRL